MKYIFFFIFLLIANIATAQHGKGLKPLEKGTDAPSFSAKNQFNKIVKSTDLLAAGDIVLIFYRGSWCPHCKKHIHDMQEGFQQILDKNASVVVVTPEKPEYIEKMISKTEAKFSVLHDKDYKIMEAYNVKYTIQKEDKMFFNGYVIAKS
jgi:peroxiredoxin